MPKPEPEPGEMIPDETGTAKKGKRKKKKKGVKAVSRKPMIFMSMIHINLSILKQNQFFYNSILKLQAAKANPEGKTKLARKPKLKRLGTFPCDRCGKMFKRTDHLLRHIRETHNNIKKVLYPI